MIVLVTSVNRVNSKRLCLCARKKNEDQDELKYVEQFSENLSTTRQKDQLGMKMKAGTRNFEVDEKFYFSYFIKHESKTKCKAFSLIEIKDNMKVALVLEFRFVSTIAA